MKARRDNSENLLLSDVCIATSAAPYYLPPYPFQHKTPPKEPRDLNLIDGGVAVNNPNCGLIAWFFGPNGTTPLLDVCMAAMDDMVDIYMRTFREILGIYTEH
ncbi:hypothetical protein FEM48_Zijuj07G0155500 [Ziziphus jujuba var. spinosa]|uniref:Patatin n=1 Tax=Ziziphus jujuba var. spinosa TaxID=714518 RepID=A0A978V5G4_ZIZJJ|nr:hypothetical protein FEM48_Zijuj07G0155500 [Ziziphus jujuba var. spinosa]